jgi:spermidine/putrescine transport system substrate-binding protein
MLRKNSWLLIWTLALGVAATGQATADTKKEINALVWCDHTDDALLNGFTQKTGIKVNTKIADSTGAALAILEQSKASDWDVLVLDSTDVHRVVGRGLLETLDPQEYSLAAIPEAIRLPEHNMVDGRLYAIPEKFGYNAIAFDSNKVSADQVRDITNLWNPKYKGQIAIYDYYLPLITQIAVALGKSPSKLTESDLPAIKETLIKMRQNAALVGDITTSQTALATGRVSMIAGGGEFIVSGLKKAQPNLDWILPSAGSARWQQSIAILADSTHKSEAKVFVQYILSPEGQARLATSSCYWGMPANSKATLTEAEKATLRWNEQPGFIANSFPYISPTEKFDAAMQDLWAEVMQK